MIVGDGDHRQPQRGRRRHHFQLGHPSGGGRRDHPAGPAGGEHGGAREAPGGGAARERRPRRRLPLPRRRVPGHPVRARAPPPLPRVPRLGHRRLRLRQRRRRAPGLRAGGAAAAAGPEQRRHGAGPGGPQPEHGHVRAPVPRRAGVRPGRPGGPDVPGLAVEGLLADGVRAVLPGRARGPQGVAGVGRGLRARHALLRGVPERGARGRHGGARQLARVPRHHGPERGRAVHRRPVHPGRRLAQRHRRALHRWALIHRSVTLTHLLNSDFSLMTLFLVCACINVRCSASTRNALVLCDIGLWQCGCKL